LTHKKFIKINILHDDNMDGALLFSLSFLRNIKNESTRREIYIQRALVDFKKKQKN
jgi:hypothetical protein